MFPAIVSFIVNKYMHILKTVLIYICEIKVKITEIYKDILYY